MIPHFCLFYLGYAVKRNFASSRPRVRGHVEDIDISRGRVDAASQLCDDAGDLPRSRFRATAAHATTDHAVGCAR